MYCINCGVKLADTEKQCPLCGVRVFHPDLERPEAEPLYPADQYPVAKSGSKWPHIIFSIVFLLPLALVLLWNLQIDGKVTWAGYVIGSLLVGYVVLVLPVWFRKPNPVVFVPCGFAAAAVFLLYVNWTTGGGWYLSFALPVIAGFGLIVTAVVTMLRYLRRGKLYIFGGMTVALGGMMLLVEFLMDLTFEIETFMGWSLYPLITLVLLGSLLIFLAICRPAREIMERKFFI